MFLQPPSSLLILDPFLNGPDGGTTGQMFHWTLGVFVCLCVCACVHTHDSESVKQRENQGGNKFNLRGRAESGESVEE